MKNLTLTLAILLGCLFSNAQVNLNSSLTACYALNGNANEAINNLTGTLVTVTSASDRFNNANSALQFPGSFGAVVLLPNSAFTKPATDLTFSGWYNLSGLNYSILVFTKNIWSSYFTSFSLVVDYENGGYRFKSYRQDGSGSDVVTSTTTIQANTWYHVVFTISNNAMQLYVNGVLEDAISTSITSFNYDSSKEVVLGGTNESNFDQPLFGTIDNVRIYDRILNSSEVTSLYQLDPVCLAAAVPVASYTLPSSQICVGTSLMFSDQSTNSPNAWNYTLVGPATYTSNLQNPIINVTVPGTYVVSQVASNSAGASAIYTNVVQVFPNPTVMLSATRTKVCRGDRVNVLASGASTYVWNILQTGSTFSFSALSSQTITVTGTDNNGCSSTAAIVINVNECLGVEEFVNKDVQIYPQPVSDIFTITGLEDYAHLSIYSASGQLLLQQNATESQVQIDFSNYAEGFYQLIIQSSEKTISRKIVKTPLK